VVGTVDALASIVQEARYWKLQATIVAVQPGMSRAVVSENMRALLGGTDRFLADTYGMKLRVIGSAQALRQH
jgi:hypothetical protein